MFAFPRFPGGLRFPRWSALLPALATTSHVSSTHAQCDPRWATGFEQAVVADEMLVVAVHQDALVLGGYGSGFGTPILRLQDGLLSTIGLTNNNPFGSEPEVRAVLSFDFGSGPEVVVGGVFDTINGTTVTNVARWDGSAWHALGTGLADAWSGGVTALCAFNDGSGTKLYAGGVFDLPGGGSGIARWNGSSFESVGGALISNVSALCVHDDGSGRALYAEEPSRKSVHSRRRESRAGTGRAGPRSEARARGRSTSRP